MLCFVWFDLPGTYTILQCSGNLRQIALDVCSIVKRRGATVSD
jgi:hypothetical protein